MKKPDYQIRPYQSDDFEKLAALYIRRGSDAGRKITPNAIAGQLKRPGFNPEKDIVLAVADDAFIGYAHMIPERSISRILLRGWVDPSWRRKEIATGFLRLIEQRTKELGARIISSDIRQENRIARDVLPKLGFRYVRRYLDLTLNIDKRPAGYDESDFSEYRSLLPGEEEDVLTLQNTVFSDHWRYSHYDLETFLFDINWNNRSQDDILVHCDGDKIIAYCWTEIEEFCHITGIEIRGAINMIGVDENCRLKGIGKRTLRAAFAHLRNKGANSVSLQVDSENKTARELYFSVGFKECGSTLWYEKETN